MDYETLVSGLKFDEKGLIPVVVQDYVTHEVLTLAYMNRESLKKMCIRDRTRTNSLASFPSGRSRPSMQAASHSCPGSAAILPKPCAARRISPWERT